MYNETGYMARYIIYYRAVHTNHPIIIHFFCIPAGKAPFKICISVDLTAVEYHANGILVIGVCTIKLCNPNIPQITEKSPKLHPRTTTESKQQTVTLNFNHVHTLVTNPDKLIHDNGTDS